MTFTTLMHVLLQVNASGEGTKGGFAPSEASRPWSRGEWIWGTRDLRPLPRAARVPAHKAAH